MTISRIINGTMVNIELSAGELREAYMEQERNYDMEDVRSLLNQENYYWKAGEAPKLTDEQVENAALIARDWMDDNDVIAECRWDCIADAIKEVLK